MQIIDQNDVTNERMNVDKTSKDSIIVNDKDESGC